MDTGFLNPMPLQVINQELSVPGLASTCVERKSFICNLVETTFPFPLFNLATNFKFCSSHLLCNVDRSLRVEREWAAQKPRLAVRQRHEDDHLVLRMNLQYFPPSSIQFLSPGCIYRQCLQSQQPPAAPLLLFSPLLLQRSAGNPAPTLQECTQC